MTEYYIRADGSGKTGAGHLMRCLTIAEALRKQVRKAESSKENDKSGLEKDRICFLSADEASAEFVRQRGYEAKVLHTDPEQMEEELPVLEELFKTPGKRLFLADSYFVTPAYLQALGKYGPVVLMDDMAEQSYPVDMIVNYNLFASPQKYRELYPALDDLAGRGTFDCIDSHKTTAALEERKTIGCIGSREMTAGMREGHYTVGCIGSREMTAGMREGHYTVGCIGSHFVPVRQQFVGCAYQIRKSVKQVLITAGGGDEHNIAGQIAQALLNSTPGEDICFGIVSGSFHPHFQKLKAWEKECSRIRIFHDVKDMAGLMKECDLAITAGGTTVYELAALGVPFICFSYAANQEALAEYIGTHEIAGYAGKWHKDRQGTMKKIQELFSDFCKDPQKREEAHTKEIRLVDGQGADRIAQAIRMVAGQAM